MDNSLIVDGFNIADLNDDQLADQLMKLGFRPGPIVASTRSVYQRKLAKLIRNDDVDEDEENSYPKIDDEVMPSPVLSSSFQNNSFASTSSSPFRYDDLRRRPLQRVEGDSFDDGEPPILSPYDKPWSIEDITTQVSEPLYDSATASPFSLTAKVAMFAFLLLFVFLVYYNMESNPTNPFPLKPSNSEMAPNPTNPFPQQTDLDG